MGLVLYFISPLTKGPMSDPSFRYWKVEHISMMVIAIILITIGNAKSKKGIDGVAKHRTISLFFGIALIIIIVAILLMTKSVPGTSFFGIS